MFLVVSGIPNLFKNLLASLPKIPRVSRNDPGHDLKSALFLDVPSSIFLGRGDLELGGPLAQSCGAKVKTFNAEISFEIILEIWKWVILGIFII